MKKNIGLMVLMAMLCATNFAFGQSSKQDKDQQSESTDATSTQKFYRLDYVLREMDGTKEISKRNYTISVRSGNSLRQLRMGSRVPVSTGPAVNDHPQYQYMDVGMNVDTLTREDQHGVWLDVTGELSSIAVNEGASNTSYSPPLVRQAKVSGSVPIIPGKSMLVFSADEPTTTRRFELSVTATQVR